MADQKTPLLDEEDLERVVHRDFAPGDVPVVLDTIAGVNCSEKIRVMVACVKIAKGNVQVFLTKAKEASGYWREIIMKAEYPLCEKLVFRMEEMTEEEQQSIYDQDWDQYQAWLNAS